MSNKDRAKQLIDELNDNQINAVIFMIESFKIDTHADDEEDDAICQQLYQNYLNSSSEDKQVVPFEQVLRENNIEL